MSRLYAQILGERLSGTPHLPGRVAAPEPSVSGVVTEIRLADSVMMILRLGASGAGLSESEFVARAIVHYADNQVGLPMLMNGDLYDLPDTAREGGNRFKTGP